MDDLISWVSLRDDEGHLHARFCPDLQILVIKKRGREHRFDLKRFPRCSRGAEQSAVKSALAIKQESC